jgi:GNAT superfamily N-acetyltransferase
MVLIRTMRAADVELGLRLCRQAGWNQLDADWQRFLEMQPDGCFVAELEGTPVGTTTTCIFGPVAWIAMVLVDVKARRKGVATALLKHALDFLDSRQVKTVRLDATAAGQPVYEKLGFTPEYPLTRYEGTAPQVARHYDVTEATTSSLAEIFAFDQRMTGAPREKMLSRLFAESPEALHIVCREGQIEGYATVRRGANAIQIGPCIATASAGPALLADALNRCAGRSVLVDVPRDNAGAMGITTASGLRVQRHFTRMCRGDRVNDHVEAIWASSGPEKG